MAKKTIYSNNYRKLAETLRSRREEQGISQTVLSGRLNWSQQRLSAVESGARRLDVLEFVELADALGQNPCDLLQILIPRKRC